MAIWMLNLKYLIIGDLKYTEGYFNLFESGLDNDKIIMDTIHTHIVLKILLVLVLVLVLVPAIVPRAIDQNRFQRVD